MRVPKIPGEPKEAFEHRKELMATTEQASQESKDAQQTAGVTADMDPWEIARRLVGKGAKGGIEFKKGDLIHPEGCPNELRVLVERRQGLPPKPGDGPYSPPVLPGVWFPDDGQFPYYWIARVVSSDNPSHLPGKGVVILDDYASPMGIHTYIRVPKPTGPKKATVDGRQLICVDCGKRRRPAAFRTVEGKKRGVCSECAGQIVAAPKE